LDRAELAATAPGCPLAVADRVARIWFQSWTFWPSRNFLPWRVPSPWPVPYLTRPKATQPDARADDKRAGDVGLQDRRALR